jgi:DNA-binding winged helix-turn-helix (wHTH) protein/TolB-like protein/Tfp pilus assembly protein PilF
MSLDLKSNLNQINLSLVKPSSCSVYEFDDYRLEAEHLMLYRSGAAVSLTPKQVETLLALVEKKGEIVSKDELMTRLWGDSAVEESNLVQNIYIVRKTLGLSSDGRPMIETLRRRGYRFHGELKESGEGTHERGALHLVNGKTADRVELLTTESGSHYLVQPAAVSEVVKPSPFDKRNSRNVIIAVFLLVGVIAAGYLVVAPRLSTAGSARPKSMAVLPLKPIDTVNRSDIYEFGLADAVINRINSIEGFIARPLTATRKYDAIDQDALAAGREQNVDYVLASNYQIASGKIRITSELFDVASGTIIDTYRNEQNAADIFGAQDAIAADLGNRIMRQFSGTLTGRPASRGTSNEEAYRYYQQAQYLSAQTRARGIESLEKAVSLDPNYARAWAALAYAYTGGFDRVDTDKDFHYRKSMEAVNRALALDPALSETYSALCINRMFYERNAAGAEDVCKTAVDLEPNSAPAHAVYATFLSSRARHDEAYVEIKTAMELEPASYYPRRWHANLLYWARRYDETIAEVKRLLEVNPDDISRHRWLMWSYENQGKYSEAFQALLGLLAAYNKDQGAVDRYKAVFQTAGWSAVLVELEKEDGLRFNSYRRAALNAQIGNMDKAFECLEKAYAERDWEMAFLQVDPGLDPLREDPRYAELVKRIETK